MGADSYMKNYKFEVMFVIVLAALAFESTCAPTIDNSVIPNLDKLIHFIVFGCIAWLIASMMENKAWFRHAYITTAMFSIVAVALLGVGDEYLQSFTSTRHAELDDVFADVAGAALFLSIWTFCRKRLESGCEL